MASNIVPGNVDNTYPTAGQDNSSQGFRDNFSATKNNFTEAKTEIEALQTNKASLNASSDFADNEVTRAKLKDTSDKIKTVGRQGRGRSTTDTTTPEPVKEKPKTPEQIIAGKFHDMVSDYNEAIDNFSNVAAFKQKWNGVALTRRPRQDGTKTVLINSSRAFEKSEIWCVNFSDKYFAFPCSSVFSSRRRHTRF